MACRSAVTGHELEDVSWSDVIKVEMHCQVPAVCTRCGQRPFMPRIGLCGHVYCFPCIWIRIAFDHDERVETCPACGRSLKTADLKSKYGELKLPKKVSGRVAAVERFTMDSTIRDVFQPLRHLPLGRTFYFVVLDFDAPIFSDNEYLQTNYEKTLIALSKSQSNISAAVGHYVNNKLSLDIKRTNIYFADELFSLPRPDQGFSRKGRVTKAQSSQKPIRWHIITLPSGSQAFFTDPLLRKYLQGDLPESH
ncbi:RING finger protein 10 [Taenia solium]|eukprot:TsM_000900000 transcript=TsM_000900000 gene=TsM_000900000